MGSAFSHNHQDADQGHSLTHAIKHVAEVGALGIARPSPLVSPPAATLNTASGAGETKRSFTPPPPDKPTPRGHRTFALTIGINTYDSPSFKSEQLKGAVNDADNFERYLREDLRVPEGNITRLRNGQATRSAIIHEFRRLMFVPSDKAAIVIYNAGHGAMAHKPDEWKGWDTPGNEIEILCPCDMGVLDENNKVIDGIPDRTIGQFL